MIFSVLRSRWKGADVILFQAVNEVLHVCLFTPYISVQIVLVLFSVLPNGTSADAEPPEATRRRLQRGKARERARATAARLSASRNC